jgi:hypothetical protein
MINIGLLGGVINFSLLCFTFIRLI